MSITIPVVPPMPMSVARPIVVGPGRPRKIGIIGGAPVSLRSAPWSDGSWEFWAHASVARILPEPRIARYFDLHPENCFTEGRKHGMENYYQFLQHLTTPVYMQGRYPEIPASVKYPLDTIREQWPDVPFGSLTAYMVALALYEGVTHLGFWGVDYAHKSEYEEQRANAEHWVGIARGAGVQIVISKKSPLCHEPALLYAYETHTPDLYAKRKERVRRSFSEDAPKQTPFDPSRLVAVTGQRELDEAAAVRNRLTPGWDKDIRASDDPPEPDWLQKNQGVPA